MRYPFHPFIKISYSYIMLGKSNMTLKLNPIIKCNIVYVIFYPGRWVVASTERSADKSNIRFLLYKVTSPRSNLKKKKKISL